MVNVQKDFHLSKQLTSFNQLKDKYTLHDYYDDNVPN